MTPAKLNVEILTLKVMIFEDEASERKRVSDEVMRGRALMMGLVPL